MNMLPIYGGISTFQVVNDNIFMTFKEHSSIYISNANAWICNMKPMPALSNDPLAKTAHAR